MDGRSDRGGVARRGDGKIRFISAAIQYAVARARKVSVPLLREERDLADRVVAARARSATGKYKPGVKPPADSRAANPENQEFHCTRYGRRNARSGPKIGAHREGSRLEHGATSARMGSATKRAGIRHYRRVTTRTDTRQYRRDRHLAFEPCIEGNRYST